MGDEKGGAVTRGIAPGEENWRMEQTEDRHVIAVKTLLWGIRRKTFV
jgi:hypothetical protein